MPKGADSKQLMPAVVLGLDLNGLGVARALGRAAIPVIGVDSVLSHPGRASRYCGQVVDADPCSADTLLEALGALAKRLDGPAVLFPTMDDTVRILSRHRDDLRDAYRLSLPDAAMVKALMDKAELAKLGVERGWPVPFTTVCRSEAEVAEAARNFPFPGVMKPGERELGAPRGIPRKLWTFENAAELIDGYRELSRWEPTVVLQERVQGGDSDVAFCLYYCDSASRIKVSFVGRKLRQHPPLYGSTSSAEPAQLDEIREFAERFTRDVAYRGLGSVELKRDSRSGAFRLIEPTVGRTDYQSFLAVANGVNIPEVAYRDLAGLEPAAPRRGRPAKYVMAYLDLRSAALHVRAGRETWGGYLKSLRGRKVFGLFQPHDPGPFLYRIHYATLGRLLRVVRRAVGAL
jgi:predicted ATP-grasp superfamily ATP-dependent carboligase